MKSISIDEVDWKKQNGLIPVIVQDESNKRVLMVAYANKQAIEKTLSTGCAHFWSRSRRALWMKGETSGNTQKVVRIMIDCDNDTVLYSVDLSGPACHTGEMSCFYRELS